jgi:type I restriction enzyme S subunit
MKKASQATPIELEDHDDLPDGWSVALLGDVSIARLGKTPSKNDYSDTGPHRIVKFRDLTSKGLNYSITKAGYVKNTPEALRGLRRLSIGDVLVTASAHSGDQIGKKCVYVSELPDARDGAYFVGELLAVTSDSRVMHKKWPYLWFLSEAGMETVQAAVAGVHLTAGRAQGIPLPIPPIDEQRRIVVSSDQLLAKLGVARDHLSKLPKILRAFRQSVLAAACSGRLTEDWRLVNKPSPAVTRWGLTVDPLDTIDLPELPETWVWRKLDDFSDRVSVGHVGPTSRFYCRSGEGIQFVRSQNVRPMRLVLDDVQYITRDFHESLKKSQLQPGDLLIVRVGANRGDTCIVPKGIGPMNCANIVFARPLRGISDYLEYYCQSKLGQDLLIGMTTGSAQGVLNTKSVAELPIPIPPEVEQHEIVRRVETLFKLTDKIEERFAAATKRADKLTQAILAKAFRGQLVPTEAELAHREGRTYEPAAALLERIKSERAKSLTPAIVPRLRARSS